MSDATPRPEELGMTWAGATTFARLPNVHPDGVAEFAIVGVPYDLGVTNRPGARFGPRAIREQSSLSAEFGGIWPWPDNVLGTRRCIDAGDIAFRVGSTDLMLDAVRTQLAPLLAGGTRVVALGGDHLVTLPLLQAHAEVYGQMALVHVDAHSDTWEYGETDPLHHGMMFLKAARDGLIDPARSVQIGMRTPNDTMGFNVFDMNAVVEHGIVRLAELVHELTAGAPVYLTIDIDGLDPAFAPATGTPVVGGFSTAELRSLLFRLHGLDIVGADVVEVAPHYEGPAQITALAGATIAQDELHLLAGAPRRS
jgi:agmatinase